MNEFRVGLLTIATCIAVAIMSIKVTSNQSGFGSHIPYTTTLPDAVGIFPKTPIKIAGINAGKIKDIRLSGNTALIEFEIMEDVVVTTGSTMNIKTVGVLGDKYIELVVNTKSMDKLAPGSYIPTTMGVGMAELAKEIGVVVADVRDIVKEFKASLIPKGQEESEVKQIVRNIREFTENAKLLTETLKKIAVDNEGKMVKIIDNIEQFTAQLRDHMDAENEDSLMGDIKQVVANADKITRDLESIVADVRNGKGTVGQLLSEDEIADEVKATLAGVKKIVDKVNSVKTEIQVYSGSNTSTGWKTDAEVWIYPSPERFFVLGASSSELGTESKTTTETDTDGTKSIQEKKETKHNTYKFTALMGRKLHNFYLRGGMIDSAAGFGVDYELPRYGMKLTAEVFDFNFERGTNLRLKTEYHLWNVVYLRAMAENAIYAERNYTFSLGFRLLDEDLKGIMGLFL